MGKEARSYERKILLAKSSCWVAVLLNLPGFGTGYIYQRRWKAYWVNAAASSSLTMMNFSKPFFSSHNFFNYDDGYFVFTGLLVIAMISSLEAIYSVKKARKLSS